MLRTMAVNTHWALRGMWNIVYTWVDKFVQKKIIICGPDYTDTILEYIDKDVLEQKHGGNKPDITENFFPPRF